MDIHRVTPYKRAVYKIIVRRMGLLGITVKQTCFYRCLSGRLYLLMEPLEWRQDWSCSPIRIAFAGGRGFLHDLPFFLFPDQGVACEAVLPESNGIRVPQRTQESRPKQAILGVQL